MNDYKLLPCPFCGGKGKVSFKDHRFGGINYIGAKKLSYRVQVICNKCRSRGRPVITGMLINPNPYFSKWGNSYCEASARSQEQTILFDPYVEEAANAWNTRAQLSRQKGEWGL